MFNISGSELVFLLLIALVVFGPEQLPEVVRRASKAHGEFKKMTSGFQSEMRNALEEPMREMRETADAMRKAANLDFAFDPTATDSADVPAIVPSAQPVSPTDAPIPGSSGFNSGADLGSAPLDSTPAADCVRPDAAGLLPEPTSAGMDIAPPVARTAESTEVLRIEPAPATVGLPAGWVPVAAAIVAQPTALPDRIDSLHGTHRS